MEDMKEVLQTAIAGSNHAQLSIMYKALEKECNRLKLRLESKTEIANQLKDGMADMFEKNVALRAERDALRQVCAEAYQMAGAIDAPNEALDNLSAAANGNPIPHKTFLPIFGDHLAAHDAEVAKAAFIAGACAFDCDHPLYPEQIEVHAEDYVSQLRAKAGE